MPRQTSRQILIIAVILFIISLVPLALAPSFAVRAAWRAAPGSRRFLVYQRCGPDMSFQKSGGAPMGQAVPGSLAARPALPKLLKDNEEISE